MRKYDLIVIGGVAAGTKAAAKARRERPGWTIALITADKDVSYAGCGLPYLIGGVVKDRGQLVARTPELLKRNHGIDVMTRHEALSIDRAGHSVLVRDLGTGEEFRLEYNRLFLATGATPIRPPIPGVDSKCVHTLRSVADADAIMADMAGRTGRAVVVGGGFIGIETAENLRKRGWDVTVMEMLPQILPQFDPEIALMMQRHLERNGVKVMTGAGVQSFSEEGEVVKVATSAAVLEAELVILSIGVKPNSRLAAEAGLELGCRGAVRVDRSGRTSDPDIFAAGDCATTFSLLDGRETWSPMGSTANKQARVAALALTSADAEFPGVLGTMIVRAFGFSAAKTGLGEREAKEAGIHAICVTVPADDRAHYHPGSEKLALKLLAAADTGEIIGCQAYGMGAADKPLDAVAVAMSLGATVDSLADVDFAYAPPFSTAINPVNLACHVLQNKMSGRMESVGCVRAKEMISSEGWDGLLLDPRDEAEFRTGSIKGAVNIQMQDFPARLHEIERYKDRDVLIVCNYGKRAYESYIRLKHCGFTRAKVLEGGTKFWPFGLE